MRIVITGSTGLVGTRLAEFFRKKGVRFSGLSGNPAGGNREPPIGSRRRGKSTPRRWRARMSSSIWRGRASTAGGQRGGRGEILLSRTRGTRLIAETLAALKRPPGVFLCASGSARPAKAAGRWMRRTPPVPAFCPV